MSCPAVGNQFKKILNLQYRELLKLLCIHFKREKTIVTFGILQVIYLVMSGHRRMRAINSGYRDPCEHIA